MLREEALKEPNRFSSAESHSLGFYQPANCGPAAKPLRSVAAFNG
jgi:hypothetical protein